MVRLSAGVCIIAITFSHLLPMQSAAAEDGPPIWRMSPWARGILNDYEHNYPTDFDLFRAIDQDGDRFLTDQEVADYLGIDPPGAAVAPEADPEPTESTRVRDPQPTRQRESSDSFGLIDEWSETRKFTLWYVRWNSLFHLWN